MKQDIKIVDYIQPVDLLDKSLVISFTDNRDRMWFKVMECGESSDGRVYIVGFDKERMNMKIYIDEIETAFITR